MIVTLPNGIIYVAENAKSIEHLLPFLTYQEPKMQEIFEAFEAILLAGTDDN